MFVASDFDFSPLGLQIYIAQKRRVDDKPSQH